MIRGNEMAAMTAMSQDSPIDAPSPASQPESPLTPASPMSSASTAMSSRRKSRYLGADKLPSNSTLIPSLTPPPASPDCAPPPPWQQFLDVNTGACTLPASAADRDAPQPPPTLGDMR